MDQTISTLISAGVPTLAIVAAQVRNEAGLAAINARLDDTNARLETLRRDINARFEALIRRVDNVGKDH